MTLRNFFGGKKTVDVLPSPEELELAPYIAGARGIVSRDEEQRKGNLDNVFQELSHSRWLRANSQPLM